MDVGVIGGSGYGGGELLRLLEHHPAFKVRVVAAGRSAGQRVNRVFPQLAGTSVADEILVEATPASLDDCQVVFAATPQGVSLALLPELLQPDRVVVDLSAAFRLPAAVFAEWYGTEHTAAGLTPAPYGLPELWRDELAGARLIAVPGCYPTAALLTLAPLVGVLGAGVIAIAGMSGWSGAGRGLRDDLHASHAHGNVAAYGAPTHRHTPEIVGQLERCGGVTPRVSFVPHLVPMARGMVVTCTAPLVDGVTPAVVRQAVEDRYADEPFVTVVPPGTWPAATHVIGGNAAQVGVEVDEGAGVVVTSCALDNLVKGAAGQAIQAANVATGASEAAGLPTAGIYP
jgi:N-acetyl-gamma-glutamyl-phosphate reductase